MNQTPIFNFSEINSYGYAGSSANTYTYSQLLKDQFSGNKSILNPGISNNDFVPNDVDRENDANISNTFQRYLKCSDEDAKKYLTRMRDKNATHLKMTKKEANLLNGFAARNEKIYIHQKELLGTGSSKVTYAGLRIDAETGQAHEVVHQKTRKAEDVTRVEKEVSLQNQFDHPHIVKIYDSLLYKEGQKIAVYAEKCDFVLKNAIEKQQILEFDLQKKVSVIRDVASALDYVHKKGYAHNDIKPDNILLKQMKGMLTDFGLCTAIGSNISFGCVRILAPETISTGVVNDKTDIYQFGYTLVLLFHPTLAKDYLNNDRKAFPELKDLFKGWPTRKKEDITLKGLITSCLDADPENRPSMELIEETLSSLLK